MILLDSGDGLFRANCVRLVEALETGNRHVLGPTAPPQGLELTQVEYDIIG